MNPHPFIYLAAALLALFAAWQLLNGKIKTKAAGAALPLPQMSDAGAIRLLIVLTWLYLVFELALNAVLLDLATTPKNVQAVVADSVNVFAKGMTGVAVALLVLPHLLRRARWRARPLAIGLVMAATVGAVFFSLNSLVEILVRDSSPALRERAVKCAAVDILLARNPQLRIDLAGPLAGTEVAYKASQPWVGVACLFAPSRDQWNLEQAKEVTRERLIESLGGVNSLYKNYREAIDGLKDKQYADLAEAHDKLRTELHKQADAAWAKASAELHAARSDLRLGRACAAGNAQSCREAASADSTYNWIKPHRDRVSRRFGLARSHWAMADQCRVGNHKSCADLLEVLERIEIRGQQSDADRTLRDFGLTRRDVWLALFGSLNDAEGILAKAARHRMNREFGLALPVAWHAQDAQAFKTAVHERVLKDRRAQQLQAKVHELGLLHPDKPFRYFALGPLVTFADFAASPVVQKQLWAKISSRIAESRSDLSEHLPKELRIPADLPPGETFLAQLLFPVIDPKVVSGLRTLVAPTEQFVDGREHAEDGKTAVRKLVVLPFALACSLLGALANALRLVQLAAMRPQSPGADAAPRKVGAFLAFPIAATLLAAGWMAEKHATPEANTLFQAVRADSAHAGSEQVRVRTGIAALQAVVMVQAGVSSVVRVLR